MLSENYSPRLFSGKDLEILFRCLDSNFKAFVCLETDSLCFKVEYSDEYIDEAYNNGRYLSKKFFYLMWDGKKKAMSHKDTPFLTTRPVTVDDYTRFNAPSFLAPSEIRQQLKMLRMETLTWDKTDIENYMRGVHLICTSL